MASQKMFDLIALVAPYAGAWIEMLLLGLDIAEQSVAPYAGAWIEIKIEGGG